MNGNAIPIIKPEQLIYSFSRQHKPLAHVKLHQPVAIQTLDCYENYFQENVRGEVRRSPTINPATGPIFVEGAEPGDTLVVDILDISVDSIGTMSIRPGAGAYRHMLEIPEIKRIPIINGYAEITDQLKVSIRPMIGVIGVAPSGEDVSTISPGKHGGNLDTRYIEKGTRLYLPVSVEGALFALGDLHGIMGDGETAVCGLEIPGMVTLSFSLIKQKQHEWPVLETEQDWMVLVSHESLDEGAIRTSESMLQFLLARTNVEKNDLVRLLGLVAHLEVSQIVNPLKTMRLRLPKSIFPDLTF